MSCNHALCCYRVLEVLESFSKTETVPTKEQPHSKVDCSTVHYKELQMTPHRQLVQYISAKGRVTKIFKREGSQKHCKCTHVTLCMFYVEYFILYTH